MDTMTGHTLFFKFARILMSRFQTLVSEGPTQLLQIGGKPGAHGSEESMSPIAALPARSCRRPKPFLTAAADKASATELPHAPAKSWQAFVGNCSAKTG